MKCKIVITGQTGGNFKIKDKLLNSVSESKRFNDYVLEYHSIKQAKADLNHAYNRFLEDEPEMKDSLSGYDLSLNGDRLSYDASTAVITYL